MTTHSETGRNLESTDDQSRFGPVDSDASDSKILIEARLTRYLRRNDD